MFNFKTEKDEKKHIQFCSDSSILKEFDNGKTAEEISRDHGVSKAALYKCCQRYGGMEASELKRI